KRLQPRVGELELAEVGAAVGTRVERVDGIGGAEPVDALAEGDVELVDAAKAIRQIGVSPDTGAAQAIARAGRRIGIVENDAVGIAHESKSGEGEIAFARSNHWIAQ